MGATNSDVLLNAGGHQNENNESSLHLLGLSVRPYMWNLMVGQK